MAIIATFHGANYFAPNHDESTIEVFETLEDAILSLKDRYVSNGSRDVNYKTLDGNEHSVKFPAVNTGDSLICYTMPDDFIGGADQDEAVEQALCAVHGGYHDYRLTLYADSLSDDVAISVSNH